MKFDNIKNVLYNWTGMIAAILYGFFITPIVVHGLGNTYYGLWNLIMSCVGYMAIMDFGIQSSVNRYAAKYKGLDDEEGVCSIYSHAMAVYWSISLLTIVAGVATAFNIDKIFQIEPRDVLLARNVMLLMVLYTAVELPCNVFGALIYAYQRFGVLNAISAGALGIQALIVCIVLRYGAGLWFFAWAIVACGLTKYFIQYLYTHRLVKKLKFRRVLLTKKTFFQLLSFSGITFLAIIANYIIFKTDNIVIGVYLSPQAIAVYSIGFMLSEYVAQIIGKMCNTLTPAFSEHAARGETHEFGALLLHSGRFSSLIGIPVGLAAIVVGREFIDLWMGPAYHDAYLVMVMLMVARMAGFPTASMYSMLYGTGKHHLVLYTGIFEAAMNLILSLILVKPYGILGVAIGTMVPMVLANLFFPMLVAREVSIDLWLWVSGAVVKPALFCAFFYLMIFGLCSLVHGVSWEALVIKMIMIGVSYLVLFWVAGLQTHERSAIMTKLKLA